jgi:MerR family transcriptional regulator/heat shock protein HspR
MSMQESEPRYVISIASRIIGIETHTLRYYEKLGLIQPFRSTGNIRYYSETEIEQLRRIKTLINDLGINIAGVEVILRLQEKIKELQMQIEELAAELQRLQQNQEDDPEVKNKRKGNRNT